MKPRSENNIISRKHKNPDLKKKKEIKERKFIDLTHLASPDLLVRRKWSQRIQLIHTYIHTQTQLIHINIETMMTLVNKRRKGERQRTMHGEIDLIGPLPPVLSASIALLPLFFFIDSYQYIHTYLHVVYCLHLLLLQLRTPRSH